MRQNPFDYLTMLFSADWFLSYWACSGLIVESKRKRNLQERFKAGVIDMIGPSKEYWHIDFTGSRIARTKTLFEEALINELGENSSDTILEILAGRGHKNTSYELLCSLTELMIADHFDSSLSPLNEDIRLRAKDIWDEIGIEPDLREICARSISKWDKYLRQLTPDMPVLLGEYAMGKVSIDKFALFWEQAKSCLSFQDLSALSQWYSASAAHLANQEVRLIF